MGSQMGKTEMIFNLIGKRFDDGPYTPALYIGPTQKQVKSISKDRIAKMIRSTPPLWDKLEKGQRDGITEKWIAGVRLGFGWAGSATELASHPAGMVMIDEYDRMDADVNGEGDPYTLAKARTKNYPGSKVLIVSTPTIEGASPIFQLYDDSIRHAWAWPCVHCADYFVPALELLRWPEKATPSEARAAAFVVCPHCGGQLETRHRHAMNRAGKYLIMDKDDDGRYLIAENQSQRGSVIGFWVSGLASPWQSFGEIAEIVVSAYRSKKPERIQAAINTYGGELYRSAGDAPKWEEVERLKTTTPPGAVPPWVQLITMGSDVQKDGIFYVIRGWGFNMQSILLGHGFIPGETDHDDVYILANRQFDKPIEDMQILRGFIDSGYRPGDKNKRPENQIYLFCRRMAGRMFPTKGHDGQDRPLKSSKIDVTAAGRIIKGGLQLWHLDTDFFKSWIYNRIRWPAGESGAWLLHSETDPDYCKQLVSEELVIKSSGRRIWVRRNRNNHYLDCEVNATAAAFSCQAHTLPVEPPPRTPATPTPGSEARKIKPRRGLF